MFEIKTDPATRIIHLRMSDTFSVVEACECAAAKEAAVDRLGPPYEDHSTLLDVRDFRIQPQSIFSIFTNFVAMTKHKSRKIAILGGSGSARMQFRRVAEREPLRADMRFFTDVNEAVQWLKAEPPKRGAPPPYSVTMRNNFAKPVASA